MKNNEEKNLLEKEENKKQVEEKLKKNKSKKKITIGTAIFIAIIIAAIFITYNYFYSNKKYITADISVTSLSKLYQNSDPEDIEDVGEGALFIIHAEGIKRQDFLDKYEVLEISINGEKVDLEGVTYRYLSKKDFSIRMHSENYNLEKGNTVIISVKQKSNGEIITRRLYNKTDIV